MNYFKLHSDNRLFLLPIVKENNVRKLRNLFLVVMFLSLGMIPGMVFSEDGKSGDNKKLLLEEVKVVGSKKNVQNLFKNKIIFYLARLLINKTC